jgi:hypothetical protein
VPLSEQRRTAHARRAQVTAVRDTVGAPPVGRGHAPCRVAPATAGHHPHLSSPFPSQSRRRPSSFKNMVDPLVRSLVTDPAPSPPLSRPYRRLRPPRPLSHVGFCRAPPLSSPLSSERPPSFAIPKLELILSFPFHTGDAGPHTRRRRPSELPPHRQPSLSGAPLPPPRRPVVRVRATPARLAQRHPEESLVLSGCTSPPVSSRRTVGKHATAPSHTR